MKPNILISGDYALMETGRLRVYYGYEEIDQQTEEWCGVVWKNGKEVARYNNSQLLDTISREDGPEAMLLATIALYLASK